MGRAMGKKQTRVSATNDVILSLSKDLKLFPGENRRNEEKREVLRLRSAKPPLRSE
jgi:hypothetical protein